MSIQVLRRNPRSSSAASMSSAILTSPPTATARLVVDTDVASFIFKWHIEFAPRYVDIVRGLNWCFIHDCGRDAPRCLGCELGTPQMRSAGSLSGRLLSPSLRQPVVFHVGRRPEREHTKAGVPSVRPTHGLQPRLWSSRRLWLRIIPKTTATSTVSTLSPPPDNPLI